jgi:hypothetical protein
MSIDTYGDFRAWALKSFGMINNIDGCAMHTYEFYDGDTGSKMVRRYPYEHFDGPAVVIITYNHNMLPFEVLYVGDERCQQKTRRCACTVS